MKILFIGDILEDGKQHAPLRVASELFRSLYSKKYDVTYLSYFKEGYRYSYSRKMFGREIVAREPDIIKYGILPLVQNIIKMKPDIVFITNIDFFLLVLFPLKVFINYKIVYTVHGVIHYELKYFRNEKFVVSVKSKLMERLIFRYGDRLLFLSNKTSRLASLYFHINKNKKVFIENGTGGESDLKEYKHTLNNEKLSIAVVAASLNYERKEKGVDLLISYLNTMPGIYNINIYGSSSKSVSKLGNVIMNYIPFISEFDLSNALLENDIVIVPSRYDNFPLSLLKTMSLGMLFLCSDRVGITEKFENTLQKFVYRYNNCQDFQEKFKYILQLDTDKLKYYSRYIKEYSLNFSWGNVSKKYINIFNGL